MRTLTVTAFAVIILLAAGAQTSRADVNLGVSIDEDGVKGFYLAIGEHYQVPEKEVVVIKKRNVPDEELPVIFFLARRCEVAPEVIIKLRLGGKSFMDICLQYGLTAELFYVPMQRTPGPPYGKAWGHFKKTKKKDWGTIRLSDVDIVNFVNLRFISNHYGYSPDEVAKMRADGASFVKINGQVKKAKAHKNKLAESEPEKSGPKGKGNGKRK
jgi:hypothetical protein